MKEATQAIFSNSQGKTITWEDLAGATGRVDYESIGSEGVSGEVRKLHRDGRVAHQEGDYDQAIDLFRKAHNQAPQWPYPTYDLAHAYLLKKDWQSALEYYEYTDKLAPRGFFLNKPVMHYLRKAIEGHYPPGLLVAYFRIQWHTQAKEQYNMAQQISEQYPGFAPVWARLAHLQGNPKVRLASIEQGLSVDPDPETKGNLLINKAMILHYSRKTQEAVQILGELVLDEHSTLATEAMARMALAAVLR